MVGWIVAIVFIGFVIMLVWASADVDAGKKNQVALSQIPNFNPTVAYGGGLLKFGVARDPGSHKFALIKHGQAPKIYYFHQLVAVEVERNGVSIQKTNRGSQIAGAAIGGMLLGPAGLLLGGLTGSKRSVDKIKKLSLKIFTNDLYAPVNEIVFFNSSSGAKQDSPVVKAASNELDRWHGRFQTILHTQSRAAAG